MLFNLRGLRFACRQSTAVYVHVHHMLISNVNNSCLITKLGLYKAVQVTMVNFTYTTFKCIHRCGQSIEHGGTKCCFVYIVLELQHHSYTLHHVQSVFIHIIPNAALYDVEAPHRVVNQSIQQRFQSAPWFLSVYRMPSWRVVPIVILDIPQLKPEFSVWSTTVTLTTAVKERTSDEYPVQRTHNK